MSMAEPRQRILIVDSDQETLESLGQQLISAGFEVRVACTTAEAEMTIRNWGPDATLLGVNLPGETGPEFLDRMRIGRPDLPFIMIADADNFAAAVECFQAGAYGCVFRPLSFNQVLINIANASYRHQTEEEYQNYRKHLEQMVGGQTRKNQELQREMEGSLDETLRALGRAFDLRHEHFSGHCPRVANLAVLIGQLLGMDPHSLTQVKWGGYLHDIGMISVPDFVLFKDGPLTKDDWEYILKHPQKGFELLHDVKRLSAAAELVLSHQERYDGKGYPQGLQGSAIPVGARVISIADAFDAMMSKRPTRDPKEFEEVKREILASARTQFDPHIVNAFVQEADTIKNAVYG